MDKQTEINLKRPITIDFTLIPLTDIRFDITFYMYGPSLLVLFSGDLTIWNSHTSKHKNTTHSYSSDIDSIGLTALDNIYFILCVLLFDTLTYFIRLFFSSMRRNSNRNSEFVRFSFWLNKDNLSKKRHIHRPTRFVYFIHAIEIECAIANCEWRKYLQSIFIYLIKDNNKRKTLSNAIRFNAKLAFNEKNEIKYQFIWIESIDFKAKFGTNDRKLKYLRAKRMQVTKSSIEHEFNVLSRNLFIYTWHLMLIFDWLWFQ